MKSRAAPQDRGQLQERSGWSKRARAAGFGDDRFRPGAFAAAAPGDHAGQTAGGQLACDFGVALRRPALGVPAGARIQDDEAAQMLRQGGQLFCLLRAASGIDRPKCAVGDSIPSGFNNSR